ncbi:MAG: lipoprotein signal peptidase [Bacteroidia bacterium]|nr:lipoprotein signal peptidase [Bacteroidia bacterium]
MKLSTRKRLVLLAVILVVIDQAIKLAVKTNMSLYDHFSVFGNWFQIFFIENEGMAFGMKFGGAVGKFLLSAFRIVLCGALVWWISSLCRRKASADAGASGESRVPVGVLVGLTLITAGAFGNIIDCLFYGIIWDYAPFMFGKVVDMFYFPIINTVWPSWIPFIGGTPFTFFDPVFNFADSCVTVGAIYLLLFQWRFFSSSDTEAKKSK